MSDDTSPDASIVIYLVEEAIVHTKGNKECSTLLTYITYQPPKSDNREKGIEKGTIFFNVLGIWLGGL